MKWFSKTGFSIFRILFGTYLTIHFANLISSGTELFSSSGVLKDATILPSYGKLPIILFYFDSPTFILIFLISLSFASLLVTFGYWRRRCSLYLFYGWMSLLNRNPFISNPSLAYCGWILLAFICIPSGERAGFLLSKKEREQEAADEHAKGRRRFEVPDSIYFGCWLITSLSYTASGIHKMSCQSWLDGSALYNVLTGVLARHNVIFDTIFPHVPFLFLQLMTWVSLFAEVSFLFLGTFFRLRKWYWLFFLQLHLGILATVNFSDLTFGMICSHLFLFDASWFEWSRRIVKTYDWNGKEALELENISKIVDSKHFDDEEKQFRDKLSLVFRAFSVALISFVAHSILTSYAFDEIWTGCYNAMVRLSQLTLDMYWGFGVCIIVLVFFMTLERIFPDRKLAPIKGWWIAVLSINVFQLFAVVLARLTYEEWLQNTVYFNSITDFHLKDHVSPLVGGFIAYLVNQWLFFWWHFARHEIYILWILLHQFHHSPERIETITSFYKHPLEILTDSMIMAVLVYSVLGLTPDSSVYLSIFSAVGEYLYHMNLKTPKLLAYVFQSPSSHRLHHRRNKRLNCPNYSDIPLFDMLAGTFQNGHSAKDEDTGFEEKNERKRWQMLFFQDVLHPFRIRTWKQLKKVLFKAGMYALVIFGCLNSGCFLAHTSGFKSMGFATVSSPLPLVFSHYESVETFSTAFTLKATLMNDHVVEQPLDFDFYSQLKGNYQRRNVYGVMLSHGPFFVDDKLIEMRRQILYYAVCEPGVLAQEFGLPSRVRTFSVFIHTKTKNDDRRWRMDGHCLENYFDNHLFI